MLGPTLSRPGKDYKVEFFRAAVWMSDDSSRKKKGFLGRKLLKMACTVSIENFCPNGMSNRTDSSKNKTRPRQRWRTIRLKPVFLACDFPFKSALFWRPDPVARSNITVTARWWPDKKTLQYYICGLRTNAVSERRELKWCQTRGWRQTENGDSKRTSTT